VNSNWLSPQASVLPDGWNLGVDADGNIGYDFAVISQASVILHDSTGQTHEYKFASGGFTPPVNESGHMTRNGDGTVTFQDSDGRTYIFNSDGTLQSSSTPVDDTHPAALQYTYGGTPSHLTQITDGVNSARWVKVLYGGDSSCPSVPSGFGAVPANMICAVTSSDANTTQVVYSTTGRLARFVKPGNDLSDYGYDSLGRILSVRDSLANDAISAGLRTQDTDEKTVITYDAIGRASSVTMPAASASDARQAHTYDYQSGSTNLHISGAVEPGGFSRKVAYDTTLRTTADTQASGCDQSGKQPLAGDFSGDEPPS
jgi:YD repeat-containing protein